MFQILCFQHNHDPDPEAVEISWPTNGCPSAGFLFLHLFNWNEIRLLLGINCSPNVYILALIMLLRAWTRSLVSVLRAQPGFLDKGAEPLIWRRSMRCWRKKSELEESKLFLMPVHPAWKFRGQEYSTCIKYLELYAAQKENLAAGNMKWFQILGQPHAIATIWNRYLKGWGCEAKMGLVGW